MATSADDRRTELSASAAQTTFTYDFEITDASSLNVTHIPIATGIPATLTQEFTGTPATGEYFVTAGFPTVKTIVVLGSDILLNDEIVIEGDTEAERITDFAPGGDYFAANINAQLDNQIDMVQELVRLQSRSTHLDPGHTSAFDTTLPTPLTADFFLAVNAAANGWAISSLPLTVVIGPASSTDNALSRFDSTTGKLVQNSGVILDDSNNMSGVNTLDIGASIPITGMLDEDTLVSDSATQVATQQSVKAYVDDSISAIATALFSGRVDEVAGISKGEVVFTSGATGNQMTVALADNSNFAEVNAIAVAFNSASNNATIQLIASGLLTDLDTSSLAEGATLYLGTSGTIVDVHPSGIDAVILIGTCVRSHASLGQIFIKIQASTDVHDFDGVARNQIVNVNTGTSAVASHSFINDANHRASISITSVANAQGSEHFSLFSDGYGNFNFLQNGNHPYKWFSDSTDSHNPANLVEIMELSSSGALTVGYLDTQRGLILRRATGAVSAFLDTVFQTQNSASAYKDALLLKNTLTVLTAGNESSKTRLLGLQNGSAYAWLEADLDGTTQAEISMNGTGGNVDFVYYNSLVGEMFRLDASSIKAIITGALDVSGVVSVDDTTDTTSGTTGSIHTDGGLGVAKKAYIVGDITTEGVVLSSVGSLSATAFGPSNDVHTGIYFPANDRIGLAIGGFLALEVDNSGRTNVKADFIADADATIGGSLNAAADTDTDHTLGRAKIGSATTDDMHLAHVDNFTSTSFAVKQTAAGAVKLNGKSGQNIIISVGNTNEIVVTAGVVAIQNDLTLGASGVNTMWNEWVSAENGMWIGAGDNPIATGLKAYEINVREVHTFTCATSVVTRVYGSIMLPEDYDGRSVVASIYWTSTDTDTTNVRFQIIDTAIISGDLLTSAGLLNGSTQVDSAAPSVASEMKTTDITFTPFSGTSGAGQMLMFGLLRNGVTDSNTGSVDIIGIKFHY